MARLIALGAFGDLLPVQIGAVTCREVLHDCLWSVAPYRGQEAAVWAALQAQHDLPKPAVGLRVVAGDVICHWIGQAQWLVNRPVDLAGRAAVSDQSDYWVAVALQGAQADQVLARLMPVDLRTGAFGHYATLRSLLGQMPVSVTRLGPQNYEIMVMRSMAASLVADVSRAMRLVAARAAP